MEYWVRERERRKGRWKEGGREGKRERETGERDRERGEEEGKWEQSGGKEKGRKMEWTIRPYSQTAALRRQL